MEDRLDQVTKHNDSWLEDRLDQVTKAERELSREVQELRRVNRNGNADVDARGDVTRPNSGVGGGSPVSIRPSGMPPATSGGGSASGGGDPTTAGSAQLVGNRRLGRSSILGGSYDFDNDGFRWGTQDDEVTFGVRALQQVDARVYANSNQEYASSGVFNPRTRFYFEGNLTRPLSYEFSLQHTYNTTNLLDSYFNYRVSDGFQLRFGRYKTPFDYEWYRIHIWHTLAPSGRRLPRTSEVTVASDSRPGEAYSIIGWNTPSGPSTGSGMDSRTSTVTRTSWHSSISSRSSNSRISFCGIYKSAVL